MVLNGWQTPSERAEFPATFYVFTSEMLHDFVGKCQSILFPWIIYKISGEKLFAISFQTARQVFWNIRKTPEKSGNFTGS